MVEQNKDVLVKRQELLAELKATGFDIKDTPEFKGVFDDLKGERKTRQQLVATNAQLQEQIDTMAEKKDGLDGKNESELLTIGEAKKLLQEGLGQAKTEDAKQNAKARGEKFIAEVGEIKTEYTTEKMGEGLDFDSILDAFNELTQQDPAYSQMVLNAYNKGQNMAKKIYDITVKNHPKIAELAHAKENTKLLEGLKTGTAAKGGTIQDKVETYQETLETLAAKPKEELDKMLAEAEKKEAAARSK